MGRETVTQSATAAVCGRAIVHAARKGIESSQRLGRHHWNVEACLSWLLNNRRLVHRYEREVEHFQAFADLGCILICHRRLAKVTN